MAEPHYNALPLHETLNLYVSPTAYVFEPATSSLSGGTTMVDEKEVRETLYVDRRTGRMALNEPLDAPIGREKVITCYGILGILSLATTDFLVIITSRVPSCRLLSQPIYLATDFRLLPLSPLSSSSSLLQHPVEKELISLVEQGLKAGRIWYSYGLDLTNSMQRQQEQAETGEGEGKWPLWKRADERFSWNRHVAGRMIDMTENGAVDLSRFILPVIFGSIELRQATIASRDLLFLLISRRSRHRAGCRYFTRGIDTQGNVANFNETEQIILLDPLSNGEPTRRGRVDGRERLSYVQVRGSVPLFWAEVNNLRYKPDLQIMDIPETAPALKKHLHSLISNYGQTYLVNLVNHKGHELPVKDAFERNMSIAASSDQTIASSTHYVYFDFHTECRKMRFDRISLLVDQLRTPLGEMAWFHSSAANTGTAAGQDYVDTATAALLQQQVRSKQTGVVRSNCMDCLDRTNVSQSALGKWAANEQLRSVGVLNEKESIEDWPEFMAMFRTVWADHGDTVSRAYSGTGALKADYTRTGKRTKEGMLHDGYKSVMRYITNNFMDGDRQDAYDIITGAYIAKRGGIPPLTDTRPLVMRAMPYVLAFALTMLVAAMTLPRTSELSIVSFVYFWFFLAGITGAYIWGNGVSYVAWPRLNPPIAILAYNGPGAKSMKRGRGLTWAGMIPFSGRKARYIPPTGSEKHLHGHGAQESGMGTGVGALSGGTGQGLYTAPGRKGGEVEMGRRKGALID